LGGAYFKKGMLDEALEQFNKAISIKPSYGEAHNNVAVVYFLKKEYKEAWRHLKIAQELHAQVNPKFVEDLKKAYPEPLDNK
jgi:tetratricopeptide (TPR) repeat protein